MSGFVSLSKSPAIAAALRVCPGLASAPACFVTSVNLPLSLRRSRCQRACYFEQVQISVSVVVERAEPAPRWAILDVEARRIGQITRAVAARLVRIFEDELPAVALSTSLRAQLPVDRDCSA
jgi:hypothetical protein